MLCLLCSWRCSNNGGLSRTLSGSMELVSDRWTNELNYGGTPSDYIVLTGTHGVGKSTLANRLVTVLGRDHRGANPQKQLESLSEEVLKSTTK